MSSIQINKNFPKKRKVDEENNYTPVGNTNEKYKAASDANHLTKSVNSNIVCKKRKTCSKSTNEPHLQSTIKYSSIANKPQSSLLPKLPNPTRIAKCFNDELSRIKKFVWDKGKDFWGESSKGSNKSLKDSHQTKDIEEVVKSSKKKKIKKKKKAKQIPCIENQELIHKSNDPPPSSPLQTKTYFEKEVFIIVDTNIFMGNRQALCMLRQNKPFGDQMKIVVPYIVLKELDSLKTNTLKNKDQAQKAIKWINFYLERKDPFFIGQSLEDFILTKSDDNEEEKGDDSILNCCIHYKKKGQEVYLLSDDVNLRNRAIVSDINILKSTQENVQRRQASYDENKNIFLKDDKSYLSKQVLNCGLVAVSSPVSSRDAVSNRYLAPTAKSSPCDYLGISHPVVTPTAKSVTPTAKFSPCNLNAVSNHDVTPTNKSYPYNFVATPIPAVTPNNQSSACNIVEVSNPVITPPTKSSNINSSNEKISINQLIQNTLGTILTHVLKDAYGDDLWDKIVFRKPPWTSLHILECFNKHWVALFIDKFPDEFRNIVNLLKVIVSRNPKLDQTHHHSEAYSRLTLLYKLAKKEPYRGMFKSGFDSCKINQEISSVNSSSNSSLHKIEEKSIIQQATSGNIKDIILFIGNTSLEMVQRTLSNENRKPRFAFSVDFRNRLRSLLVAFGHLLISFKNGKFGTIEKSPNSIWDVLEEFCQLTQTTFSGVETDGSKSTYSSASDVTTSSTPFSVFATSDAGQQFFFLCVSDLEQIINMLDVIPTAT